MPWVSWLRIWSTNCVLFCQVQGIMTANKPCRIAASTNRTYLDPSQNIQTLPDLNTHFLILFTCCQTEVFSEVQSLKFYYWSCTAQCMSSIPCHCSSLPCVNVWSITLKSWSREPIWIEAGKVYLVELVTSIHLLRA